MIRYCIPLLAFILAGCSIKTQINPAPQGTEISTLYIQDNPDVFMDGMLPEIVRQLERMGYQVKIYKGERPAGVVHHAEFTANWAWDLAMYLTYFRVELFQDGVPRGKAEYDARMGGFRLDKFGPTAGKIEPVLRELLKNAKPIDPPTAPKLGGVS